MYENQTQAGRALSQMGAVGGLAGANVSQTMASRLESAASTLCYQCERIESVLSKINGTPRDTQTSAQTAEKVRSTAPLAQSLEFVEASAKRLSELASNLEQVA